MKKKYLRFLKDHKTKTFLKGDTVEIPETSLGAWNETGIVEEITKKEHEKSLKDKNDIIKKQSAAARKKHQKKVEEIDEANVVEETEFEPVDLGNVSTTNATNGGDNSESGSEVLKYTLTQQDLIDETELTEGFEVGDEIEVNEEGDWMVDEDDKLIKLN